MRRLFRYSALVLAIPALYISGNIGYGTITDFQPAEVTLLNPHQTANLKQIKDSTLTLVTWNVGYGGLGKDMAFFYDAKHYYTSGDRQVRQSRKEVARNIEGTLDFLQRYDADFYLFQEVDINSKRSYYINQFDEYIDQKKDYAAYIALNLDVERIPIPLLEFWNVYGKAYSGLGTLSRYQPMDAKRLQLPGTFEWPTRIFQLDRCIGYFKYALANGKKLVVLNIHNSAYDKNGFLKKQQMDYLKNLVLEEYEAGNYVVAGGDWNQCPPNVPFDIFAPERSQGYHQSNIAADFLPQDWQWVYDINTPSNRKTDKAYHPDSSFITLIDFFLVSPNIEVKRVKGIDQAFEYSDHQPVLLEVQLK